MNEYNYIDMPDEYTRLLRVDMSTTSKFHTGLQSYILEHTSLMGIVNRLLSNGEEVDVHAHMKKLGWHGVRDRILSYYMGIVYKSTHIEKVDFTLVDDILDFEQSFRFATVSGYSRLVLFGMYMKLDCADQGVDDITKHPLYPNDITISYLKKMQEKVINIDYIIILIHHLLNFLGEDKLSSFISQNFSYESIYINLSEEQKEMMAKNFLTYGASIGESELFTMKIV